MLLLLATKNLHKIRELREMLNNLPIEILSLCDFPTYIPPEENGKSFEENATIKALDAAKKLLPIQGKGIHDANQYVLADDSGLVVPALGGEPGIHSARYAGAEATDAKNRALLLSKIRNLSPEMLDAYYVCHLTVATKEGVKKQVHATCEGTLILNERGRSGFGYDPLFVKHDYDKTFAELDESTKNKISHRRKALDKMLIFLEGLLIHETPSL